MIVIEKMEIKSFRSFGNRKVGKVVIDRLNHLNIFSGSNDSGKSNILRALNLFFNKHTDLNTFFDFEKDFFKKENYDSNDVGEKVVTVKIYFSNVKNKNKNFNNPKKIFLPEKFWVSRKFFKVTEYSSFTQDDGLVSSFKYEKKDHYPDFFDISGAKETIKSTAKASLKKQLTQFIDSIQYHYIPAIKDKNYFSHLYGELQQTLWKEEKSSVLTTKESFEQSIQQTTEELMDEFKLMADDQSGFSPAFELPSDLIEIFRSLDVNTGNVKLSVRGDGIQAKLIPEILYFIAKKEKSYKTRSLRQGEKAKKYFIWGFEEPENSYEYKNAQMLAEKFKNLFSNDIQILLTTHSFNFLSLEGKHISTYRVYKDSAIEATNIQLIKKNKDGKFDFSDNENSLLHNELGVFSLNKQLEQLYLDLEEQKTLLETNIRVVEERLSGYDTPLIVTEGKTDWKHLKKALQRLQENGDFTQLNIAFLEYEDDIDMGDSNLDLMCQAFLKTAQDKKTIFLFDRDNDNIRKKYAKAEYNSHGNNVYSFCIPEINDERKNISIEFYYKTQDLKTEDENQRRLFIGNEFYVNSGNSECGNYQTKIKNKAGKLEIIDQGVYKMSDHQWQNSIALSKNNFAEYILHNKENFTNFDLEDFKFIFTVIENIIQQ